MFIVTNEISKMLFKSSFYLLIYSSVLMILIHFKRLRGETSNYALRCSHQNTPVDQIVNPQTSRKKRFVLFPEFINFLNDWRYIHRPKAIFYWIANFYPQKVDTEYLHRYVKEIIRQINMVLDEDITVEAATDPGGANFHYTLFDYTKCPTDDLPEATIENIQVLDPLLIYPVELTRKSRYRAHGGIHFVENDRPISSIKLNAQQTYLLSDDFVYDPTIYTCDDNANQCEIDLFWVLLHETLHGFGIEHTTNAQQPTPPNPHMQSIMHFANFRMLCHDDIRAIRKIYNLNVIRENAVYDDTCRRDFPMNFLQKLMHLIGRCIIFGFIGFIGLSFMIFILTLVYLLIRYLISKRKPSIQVEKPPKVIQNEKSILKTKGTNKPHGYLWHDDII